MTLGLTILPSDFAQRRMERTTDMDELTFDWCSIVGDELRGASFITICDKPEGYNTKFPCQPS